MIHELCNNARNATRAEYAGLIAAITRTAAVTPAEMTQEKRGPAASKNGLVPLPAIKDRKSYAAAALGLTCSTWHLAITFATDFEVQLNG
jgi:hypothetical protein